MERHDVPQGVGGEEATSVTERNGTIEIVPRNGGNP